MQDLGRRDPAAVVAQYEAGQVPVTEATVTEYVKALAALDRLDGAALLRTVHQGQPALPRPSCPLGGAHAQPGCPTGAALSRARNRKRWAAVVPWV